jgi:hypothetical protein
LRKESAFVHGRRQPKGYETGFRALVIGRRCSLSTESRGGQYCICLRNGWKAAPTPIASCMRPSKKSKASGIPQRSRRPVDPVLPLWVRKLFHNRRSTERDLMPLAKQSGHVSRIANLAQDVNSQIA